MRYYFSQFQFDATGSCKELYDSKNKSWIRYTQNFPEGERPILKDAKLVYEASHSEELRTREYDPLDDGWWDFQNPNTNGSYQTIVESDWISELSSDLMGFFDMMVEKYSDDIIPDEYINAFDMPVLSRNECVARKAKVMQEIDFLLDNNGDNERLSFLSRELNVISDEFCL